MKVVSCYPKISRISLPIFYYRFSLVDLQFSQVAFHSMGEAQHIRDLPEEIAKKIAAVFDACDQPNWRSLMEVIRNDIPSYNPKDGSDYYKVAMETLLPGGSPTTALLGDLMRRGRTLGNLINWISSMPGRTPSVQTVLNVLSTFAICCTAEAPGTGDSTDILPTKFVC